MKEPKLLLVDDVDYSRQLLRNNIMSLTEMKLLKYRTFNFFNAGTAADAKALFTLHQPDIVFLDIELPDYSGLELLAQFKQQKPSCFIAMISGASTLENVTNSIKMGAATFIAKPFTGDKILAAMRLMEKQIYLQASQRTP
ncbi:MAG: response regulator [Rheinheimera sp.]|uniref:response regulator n=1 Tax=Arsukibacterium sp. UBA3155 TaxID=1946058 RepID=UPI000C94DC48|nr:response regulator [Arsukibacterium sp. UBA3155]MAD76538.1 response regulator [Rheinheimera sp.]|tara:strand:- start:192533 stop:192955 length:423 start_codon:yes stop_codon:yes gene_type:complete